MDEREEYTDDLNDWETDQVYKDKICEDLDSYRELDRDYVAERNAVVDSYDPADRLEGWPFIDPDDRYIDEDDDGDQVMPESLCCDFCGSLTEAMDAEAVGELMACKQCIADGVRDRVRGPIAPPPEGGGS